MIIFVLDVIGIFPDKSEGDSPVSANLYRPCAPTIALEWVKIQTGKIHIIGRYGHIQTTENDPQPIRMLGLDTCFASGGKEPLKPFVLEAADHSQQCNPVRYSMQPKPLQNSC